jgi:hypothetical protein
MLGNSMIEIDQKIQQEMMEYQELKKKLDEAE